MYFIQTTCNKPRRRVSFSCFMFCQLVVSRVCTHIKISDVYNYKLNCFSSISDGVDVIAMVPKEARGVTMWITGQVILDHISVLHQEGWDDPTQDIASLISTYDLILRILDNFRMKWLCATRLIGGTNWHSSNSYHLLGMVLLPEVEVVKWKSPLTFTLTSLPPDWNCTVCLQMCPSHMWEAEWKLSFVNYLLWLHFKLVF